MQKIMNKWIVFLKNKFSFFNLVDFQKWEKNENYFQKKKRNQNLNAIFKLNRVKRNGIERVDLKKEKKKKRRKGMRATHVALWNSFTLFGGSSPFMVEG